jgi:putative spermidine/putrescine transport system substrate-binding protein
VFPLGNVPRGWADFYDLRKFPGKRAHYKARPQFVLEAALVADGVDPKRLYPLDVDRALRKLTTVKDAIVWAQSTQQCAQLLRDRVAVMGACFSGRIYDIQGQGSPVAMQWNQAFTVGGYLVVPKGSTNVKEAMKLIAYITSAEHNADMSYSDTYPVPPVNVKALSKVDHSKSGALGTPYANRAIAIDDSWWTANFEAVNQRWQEWLLK